MPAFAKRWTLDEVHALPDDGNKYELIHGKLLVTPAPTNQHETILARLTRILEPYVAANDLGYVYHPRAVFRIGREVEVEPDLMIRLPHPGPEQTWETAPLPILVVEVASDSTRARDRTEKRSVYMEAGIPAYWVIDDRARTIRVVRPGREDVVAADAFEWSPAGVQNPLVVLARWIFEDAKLD